MKPCTLGGCLLSTTTEQTQAGAILVPQTSDAHRTAPQGFRIIRRARPDSYGIRPETGPAVEQHGSEAPHPVGC